MFTIPNELHLLCRKTLKSLKFVEEYCVFCVCKLSNRSGSKAIETSEGYAHFPDLVNCVFRTKEAASIRSKKGISKLASK